VQQSVTRATTRRKSPPPSTGRPRRASLPPPPLPFHLPNFSPTSTSTQDERFPSHETAAAGRRSRRPRSGGGGCPPPASHCDRRAVRAPRAPAHSRLARQPRGEGAALGARRPPTRPKLFVALFQAREDLVVCARAQRAGAREGGRASGGGGPPRVKTGPPFYSLSLTLRRARRALRCRGEPGGPPRGSGVIAVQESGKEPSGAGAGSSRAARRAPLPFRACPGCARRAALAAAPSPEERQALPGEAGARRRAARAGDDAK
jgi:hypothetical protein